MERVILHYDMDAFYASVEIRDNPKLRNKPVVVGESIVTTASYPARKYGIHSAMSIMEARKLCSQLVIVPVNKEKYMEISNFIHSLIEKVSKKVEYIALDEGFLDITNIIEKYSSKQYFAQKFKERIYKNTGLTCSVGIGYNKLSAKIASDINKPNGYYIFNNSDEFIKYIENKNIKIIPGVGKKLLSLLGRNNIKYPKDIYKFSLKELISKYGKSRGFLLYYYSRGIDDSPVERDRKSVSIGNENTYRYPLTTEEELIREYSSIFERTYERLKKKEYLCSSVGIKIRYENFKTITRSKNLFFKTDDKILIFSTVQYLMEDIEIKENIRLVGIFFNNLVKKKDVKKQLELKFKNKF